MHSRKRKVDKEGVGLETSSQQQQQEQHQQQRRVVGSQEKRHRIGMNNKSSSESEMLELDFLGAIPSDPVAFDVNDIQGSSLLNEGRSNNRMDYLTMTTPDHCLVMAQKLVEMSRKGDLCDIEILFPNDRKRRKITLHSVYCCAASPVLRSLILNKRNKKEKPTLENNNNSSNNCINSNSRDDVGPDNNNNNSSSSNQHTRNLNSRSPSSHSIGGDTDLYESSTCSSKGSILEDEQNGKSKQQQRSGGGSSSTSSSSSNNTNQHHHQYPNMTTTLKQQYHHITSSKFDGLSLVLNNENIEYETFQMVRTYIYTGILQFTEISVFKILEAGLYLEMENLVNLTLEYIQANISIQSVYSILTIASKHRILSLEESACDFFDMNFDTLVENKEEWCKLDAQVIDRLLCRDTTRTFSEINIFRALSTWSMSDPQNREKQFVHIVQSQDHIRLSNMTREELIEMSQHPFVAASNVLRKILYDEAIFRQQQRQQEQQQQEQQQQQGPGSSSPNTATTSTPSNKTFRFRCRPRYYSSGYGGQSSSPTSPSQPRDMGGHMINNGHLPNQHINQQYTTTSSDNSNMSQLQQHHHDQRQQLQRDQRLPYNGNSNYEQTQTTELELHRCHRTIAGYDRAICALAVLRGGDYLVSASGDHKIRIFNTSNWECERVLEGHQSAIVALEVYQDKLISASPDKTIRVWSTITWNCIAVLETPKSSVCSLAITDDRLITGSDSGELKMWGLAGWNLLRTFHAHEHVIWALARYKHNILISGSSDTTIKVWNIGRSELKLVTTLTGHKDEVQALAIDYQNDWLISGCDDGTISIHDCVSWTCIRSLGWQSEAILSLVSHREKIIAGLGNGVVKIWEKEDILNNTERSSSLAEHTSCVMALCVVKTKLVSASFDRTLKIWGP